MSTQLNRKSQQDRRREMKSRLINATINCLEEYGYHGASLTKILDSAGVSRGAWRHHYKSKKELIADAAQKVLFQQSLVKAKKFPLELTRDEEILPALLDYIWENFYQGELRNIWVELTVASRTDVELRELLAPVFLNFVNSLDKVWRKHFKTSINAEVPVEMVLNLTLYVIGGMGIQSIVHNNPDYYKSLRENWTKIISPLIRFNITPPSNL